MDVRIVQFKQTNEQKVMRGGEVYERNIYDAIHNEFSTEFRGIYIPSHRFKLLRLYGLVRNLLTFKEESDIWIRDFNSTAAMSYDNTSGKTISVFHHYDPSVFNWMNKKLYQILLKKFIANAKDIENVVTESDYWRNYLIQNGINNAVKIPNAFNFDDFIFGDDEILSFKTSHGFDEDRPIVYLGNCQAAKGVVQAYHALKDMDAYLVTSGNREVDVPTIHLELSYSNYLRLLKASSVVVTMSLFDEGWCRTAHEAMLCGTPVIGSGRGGMKELLDGGSQIVCKSFSDLPWYVESVLQDQKLGKLGYQYAHQEQFSQDHFKREWLNLIRKLI